MLVVADLRAVHWLGVFGMLLGWSGPLLLLVSRPAACASLALVLGLGPVPKLLEP